LDLRPWWERRPPSHDGEVVRAWVGRVHPFALLCLTATGLAAGGALHLAGAGRGGDLAWAAAGSAGAAYAAWSMLETVRRGRLGVDAIAVLALVGALVVGEDLAAAVVAVMVGSGRALETWAAGRARHDLAGLLERAPKTAHRYQGPALETVELEAVAPGDVLVVAPGELVPVDGTALRPAVLDESALTGEAGPVERGTGDPVRSGVVNAGGPFDLRATTRAADSAYAGIVRLVREAEAQPAPFVRLADRYAVWFLAFTLASAGVAWAGFGLSRAVAVLVVATPCPLILAAPVALVSGLSQAARRGVVIKSGGVLERLARCTTLLLDKTGTLTSGHPAMVEMATSGEIPPEDLLALAGSLDQVSPHVLATAVVHAALERRATLALPEDVEEVAGRGIRGVVGGRRVAVGKGEWVGLSGSPGWARAARRRATLDGSLTVFVGVDGRPAGVLILEDPLRPDAARTIRSLRASGIDRIVMVTGDWAEVADTVGTAIGVDQVLSERSPAEKLAVVRTERRFHPTVMVGDGINDAPALALADVGVAMGARGATASSEAADVILSVDRLDRVAEARTLALRTRRIALESVIAGMAMSLAAMVAAALGLLPAVWGAILQECIDLAVILNALRALRPVVSRQTLSGTDAALARRFQEEHKAIRTDVDRLRRVADGLGRASPAEAMAEVRQVHALLASQVVPHEQAEEELLYPAVDRALGGSHPTAPMSRAHVEIAHQTRRLGQLLDDIGPEEPDEEDLIELRRLLYGLDAVLRLHTTQEEESYLSLGEEAANVQSFRTIARPPTLA
jgi:heavy metal translocating P-type ATPase